MIKSPTSPTCTTDESIIKINTHNTASDASANNNTNTKQEKKILLICSQTTQN